MSAQYRVDGNYLDPSKIDEAQAEAEKFGAHLWVATAVHKISEDTLAAGLGMQLDGSNLLDIFTGCLGCEEQFRPALLGTPCPGDRRRS